MIGRRGSSALHGVCSIAALLMTHAIGMPQQSSSHASDALARRTAAATDTENTIRFVKSGLEVNIEKMTKEFLLIAQGVDVSANKKLLADTIKSFNAGLSDLTNGNAGKKVIAPPNARVTQQITNLTPMWTSYKALLENNADTVNKQSSSVLTQIGQQNKDILSSIGLLQEVYIAHAKFSKIAMPPAQVFYAEGQLAINQKLFMSVLFAALDVKRDDNLKAIDDLREVYNDLNTALVWGQEVLGIPDLTSLCTLHEMLKVAKTWQGLDVNLQTFRRMKAVGVSVQLLIEMNVAVNSLHKELAVALQYFEGSLTFCDFIKMKEDKEWSNGITAVIQSRKLILKAARLYLQAVRDSSVTQNQLEISVALGNARNSIGYSLKGSLSENIPAPPTQEIVDLLTQTWATWRDFEESMLLGIETSDTSTAAVNRLVNWKNTMDKQISQAGKKYVAAALKIKPSLRAIIWGLSQRQLALMEKMSSEAIVLGLADSASGKTAEFEKVASMFESSHKELLEGRHAGASASSSAYLSGSTVAKTTDSCTLNEMLNVLGRFASYKNTLIQLYGSKDFLTQHRGFITTEAASPTLVDAFVAFKSGWDSFRSTDEERLTDLHISYISSNPNAAGSKDQLDYAPGSELYHSVHKQYHKIYRDILYKRNYYDIFFLDMEGNCIYSVYKELDFATNFAANGTGKYKTSGLGDAFEAAVKNPDKINVIDWKPYGPSAGALASFLSTGIKEYGKLIGVFCTQMPPESKPIDAAQMLTTTVKQLSGKLTDFNYGNTGANINPPPNQEIADKLIAFIDEWSVQKSLYSSNATKDLKAVMAKDAATGSLVTSLVDSVIGGAWVAAPTIQGYKISMLNRQLELLQRMCRDSVLIGFKESFAAITRASLTATMQAFEDNHKVIKDGNRKRRLASKTGVAQSESVESLALLAAAMKSYNALKPELKAIADGGDATEPVLRKIVESTGAAVKSMSAAATYFASTTRTTTLMALEILAPAPFTGDWAAGQTMRTAALLAESLINQQQLILPGYQIKHVFLDDKCDPKIASQLVLEKMSIKDTYIGLGATGCSRVCSQVASTLTAIRLPMLSYACPSDQLSDTLAYPDFSRMGTVTTGFSKVIREVGSKYGWKRIFVVSGDAQEYGTEAEGYAKTFRLLGFSVDYLSGSTRQWSSIVSIMDTIKSSTQGEDRVVFVVGSETYFRKLVCASITQGLQKGIVWLSQGTWRHEWWKKSDMANSFQRQWLKEDSGGTQLKTAFQAFKSSWDAWGTAVSQTRSQLQKLYATDEKDALMSVNGPEAYHGIHTTWHPVYRKILYDRGYYDIFMFDLDGNCIYSVYKESDYATSFKTGPWKDSGLGDAFRAAVAEPDKIHYIDWKPYGPSGDAPAAFFATGLRDEDGMLIGVYSIQLPPEYEKSIEEVQKQCTLDAITGSFDGAINIAGIGKPTKELIEKPLPCFEGHSAQSFLKLLDNHLEKGFPEGDIRTQVADPYHEVKAHAVDATCGFAYAVQYLLQQGYKIENIQRPDTNLYKKFTAYLKTRMDFQGVSGKVKLTGNGIPNQLVVHQVQKGNKMEIGVLTTSQTIVWDGEGVYNTSWVKEPKPVQKEFPYMMIIYIVMSIFAVCCPCICGFASARAMKKNQSGHKSASSLAV